MSQKPTTKKPGKYAEVLRRQDSNNPEYQALF
jgi:hypothetical protein